MNFELQQILTHALGFLIFVWVLRKYAWGPLLGLMEVRRAKIAGEFEEIDNERRAKMVEAVKEGKQMAVDIKADAMNEIRALHEKAKTDLQRDVAKAKVQLRDEMIGITMAAAQKVVREKMDDAKHRDLIGRYIDELGRA